jgi:hypothetical protein
VCLECRVTRLGEFWEIVYFGQLFENYKSSAHLHIGYRATFSARWTLCIGFDNKWVGLVTFWAIFSLTNSSGHPVGVSQVFHFIFFRSEHHRCRVVRWYIFIPKIPIWAFLESLEVDNFGTFYSLLVFFPAIWYISWPFGNFVVIWCIFPSFGIL